MQKVIVAFEREGSRRRISELLGSVCECVVCRSASRVKRLARKLRVGLVVCSFKLADESCSQLFRDLPEGCAMLMLAPQDQLDLCDEEEIFKLAAPAHRRELISSVRLLLQMRQQAAGERKPRRSEEEQELVRQAKALLMDRCGMTEEEAHRFLQKRSMDAGARLADTARLILTEE